MVNLRPNEVISNAQMEEIINQTGRDINQLRKQMVSLGKQPKAAPGRKKRDMVNFLD